MAGGTGGPHAGSNVDLAEGLIGHAESVSHNVMLALILAAGQLHALLIEGAKAEAVDFAGLAHLDGQIQHLVDADAAHHIQLAHLDLSRILILLVQNGDTLLPVSLADVGDRIVSGIAADNLQGVLENTHVADDHGTAIVSVEILRSQLCDQLRANASGVTHQDTKNRFLFTHFLRSFLLWICCTQIPCKQIFIVHMTAKPQPIFCPSSFF